MLYISYLGIFDGQNFEQANTPNQIGRAFGSGFSCMINAWRIDNTICLGTAENLIEVSASSIQGERYWINAKNEDMQDWLSEQSTSLYPNYFWFPNDTESDVVETSSGKLITPGTVPVNNDSIIFLPEINDRGLFSTVKLRCYGICSSYLTFIKRWRFEGIWY